MKANYSNSAILNNAVVNAYVDKVLQDRDLTLELKKFIETPLMYILDNLEIDRFLIGGTSALMMCYNIPIRKEINDVDIIITEDSLKIAKNKIENVPFYSIVEKFNNYNRYDINSHIKIKCIQGFAVDLISVPTETFDTIYRDASLLNFLRYCPLINILKTKNEWRRQKDLDDLFFIEKWFEIMGIKKIER